MQPVAQDDDQRRARVLRSALLHAALAIGFFAAFFWVMC